MWTVLDLPTIVFSFPQTVVFDIIILWFSQTVRWCPTQNILDTLLNTLIKCLQHVRNPIRLRSVWLDWISRYFELKLMICCDAIICRSKTDTIKKKKTWQHIRCRWLLGNSVLPSLKIQHFSYYTDFFFLFNFNFFTIFFFFWRVEIRILNIQHFVGEFFQINFNVSITCKLGYSWAGPIPIVCE